MKQDYLYFLCRVIDGALRADHEKTVAYSESLAQQLEKDGEVEAAKKIRRLLANGKVPKMVLEKMPSRPATVGRVPVDSESRMPVADEEVIDRGSVSIILPTETRRTVGRFLEYFRAAPQLFASGVSVSPTVLMYGPPGTGKTLLARYIASELGMPLIVSRMDGLISSYLGSTAKNLRQLFDYASSRPCVLFLDEFDALAKMRDDGRELGELKRVVISLLQNIDALGRDHVLIAATNHDHLLDRAIWRRFAYKLKLDLPDDRARTEMFQIFLGRFGDASLLRPASILSEGLSGAQIKDVCEGAIREAVLTGLSAVKLPDLVRAMYTVSGNGNETTDRERARAIHKKNPKVFTTRMVARMLGVSQTQAWRYLNEGE